METGQHIHQSSGQLSLPPNNTNNWISPLWVSLTFRKPKRAPFPRLLLWRSRRGGRSMPEWIDSSAHFGAVLWIRNGPERCQLRLRKRQFAATRHDCVTREAFELKTEPIKSTGERAKRRRRKREFCEGIYKSSAWKWVCEAESSSENKARKARNTQCLR